MEKIYRVSGMSCGQCAQKVTAAISALPGVGRVEVDLDRGTVAVHSDATLPIDDVRAAITVAGYRLVGG